jgi:Pyruvate/2-oxoacid:ferredoxin oxidoreductase gamma subunit
MIGATSRMLAFPIDRDNFKDVIQKILPSSQLDVNLKAFDKGASLIMKMPGWPQRKISE